MQVNKREALLQPTTVTVRTRSGAMRDLVVEGYGLDRGNPLEWLRGILLRGDILAETAGGESATVVSWRRPEEYLFGVEYLTVGIDGKVRVDREESTAATPAEAILKRLFHEVTGGRPALSTDEIVATMADAMRTRSIFVTVPPSTPDDLEAILGEFEARVENETDEAHARSMRVRVGDNPVTTTCDVPGTVPVLEGASHFRFYDAKNEDTGEYPDPVGTVSAPLGTSFDEWTRTATRNAGIDLDSAYRLDRIERVRGEPTDEYSFLIYAADFSGRPVRVEATVEARDDEEAYVRLACRIAEWTRPMNTEIAVSEMFDRIEQSLGSVHVEPLRTVRHSVALALSEREPTDLGRFGSARTRAFAELVRRTATTLHRHAARHGIDRNRVRGACDGYLRSPDATIDLARSRELLHLPDPSAEPHLPGF